MKIKYCLSISFIVVLFLPTFGVAQEWERLPDLLRPRAELGNFVFKENIYILGGIHDHVYGPYNIEVLNTESMKWIDLGIWEGHRHHITAGSSISNNELWICGGKPGKDYTGLKSVQVYDLEKNSWRSGPDLPRVVWGASSVILNNQLHLTGGAESNKSTLNTHFVLDLKNENLGWGVAALLPKPVVHAAGVVFNKKIWIIGGEIEHAHTGDKTWVQIYDPATNTWSEGPPIPLARSHLEWSTFIANGKIWSVNCVDSSKPDGYRGQDEIYVYDPEAEKWKLWGRLPHNFTSAGAKITGSYLYIYGGGYHDWFDGSLREVWRTPIKAS